MLDNVANLQNNIIESLQSISERQEIIAKIIDFFPYPIQVYDPEGTSVLVNKAMLDEYNLTTPEMIIGKYNIFKDPYIIELNGVDTVKRAFRGETLYLTDIKVPLEDIVDRYGIKDLDVVAAYQDITLFPIFDDNKKVIYVVALLINRRVYRGKNEIERAREYIETNWFNKFDLNEAAKTACLSKAHFSKLFKKHTGVTPLEYYTNYKISKLKEKLRDPNLSITQAFAACNMDYNGYAARLFREKTGLTPSEYRKVTVK